MNLSSGLGTQLGEITLCESAKGCGGERAIRPLLCTYGAAASVGENCIFLGQGRVLLVGT